MRSARLHHVDALRGSVMLLLVPYHGLHFLQSSGADLAGLDFAAFWLHLWRMGLFFVVSGFFAAMTLGRQGPATQVRKRAIRLGIPLAIGMVTILPLQRLIVLWYVNQSYPGSTNPAHSWTVENILGWQPMHLWFLSYLLVVNLIAVVIWMVVRKGPSVEAALNRGFRGLAAGPLLIPVLATASATMLWAGNSVGTPRVVADSLVPHPSALAYYALFFFVGWMLFRNPALLPRIESVPWKKLGLGMLMATLAWLLFENQVSLPGLVPWPWTVSLAACLASWLTLFAAWGLFARFLSGARAWVRYLADSAYWVYLIHVPFLALIERVVAETGLPPLLQLGISTTGALGLSLLTYATLVRHSPIGSLLHGQRTRRPLPAT